MATVGDLLRQWRQQRRLSQLDLALLADVSARHVSLVETGKSKPSPDMVLRLAETLDVPLRERNHLLLAAGFAPRYSEQPLDGDALSAARDALARVLRAHEPYPALVLDRRWNILMTNRAADPFLVGLPDDLAGPPANLIRVAFHPRGLADQLVNLAEVRSVFLTRLARQLAAAPDPFVHELYEELHAQGGGAHAAAGASDVLIPMVIRVDGAELRLFSTITTFGTPNDVTLADVAIESYYPADAATAAHFAAAGVGSAPG